MAAPLLTPEDAMKIDALLREAAYHLSLVDSIEHVIAAMLDLGDDPHGLVTDAIGARWTLAQLLRAVHDQTS